MRCTSRIYLKFNDKSKWESFLKEFKFAAGGETHSLHEFLEDSFASFQFFANGVELSEEALDCKIGEFYEPNHVDALVGMIHKLAKDDAVILADSYCYSSYPEFCHELYSLGGEVHTYERNRSAEKHFHLDIADMKAWLGTTRVKELSAEEKAFFKKFA